MSTIQFKILAFSSLISFLACSQVCYDDLGCFTNDYPFGGPLRPISDLPESPDIMNVTFFLYTRHTPGPQLISHTTLSSYFDPHLPTKIIAHGWLDTSFEEWILDMKDALLEVGDYNVIAVDWGKGAGSIMYQLAAANTQIAGAETARLMQSLIDKSGAPVESFHLIGHSLGAHVSGYAAKRVKGVAQITGLVILCSF
jgi:pimeloyl-ACP methyl ester carboxylesterase